MLAQKYGGKLLDMCIWNILKFSWLYVCCDFIFRHTEKWWIIGAFRTFKSLKFVNVSHGFKKMKEARYLFLRQLGQLGRLGFNQTRRAVSLQAHLFIIIR